MTCDYDRAVPDRPPEARRSRRDAARTWAAALLGVLLALFAVLNRGDVQVDWIVGSGRAPLIIVIAVSVLLGVLVAWLGDRAAAKRRASGPKVSKPPG